MILNGLSRLVLLGFAWPDFIIRPDIINRRHSPWFSFYSSGFFRIR